MTSGNELDEKQEVPQVEEAFSQLLQKFRVGIKEGMFATISENIARTGGEQVFEVPQQLAERLATWHEYITPVRRKQILEQWFAERGVDVPREAMELAGVKSQDIRKKEEEAKAKEEAEKKKEAKFFVEEDSGRIRAAKEGETPLTWAEAERVSDRIKKDRKADEGEAGTAEPPFIVGEGGQWTLNPKGKIGFGEFAVFQMYQDSLRKGEPIDPIDELARREESSAKLKEAMGIKGEDTELTTLDKLKSLGLLKISGEGDLADTLAKLDTLGLLRKGGGDGEPEAVKELRQELRNLQETLQQKQMEAVTNELTAVKGALSNLRVELEKTQQDRTAKGEFDIMSQAIGVVDRRLGAIENTITGIFRRPPSPLTRGEKKRITEAITDEVESEAELEELGGALFGPRTG